MHKLVWLSACAVLALLVASAAYSEAGKPEFSNIKSDEHVVFFRTSAWLDEPAQEWRIPIHGWIYEPEDSVTRMGLFASILEEKYELVPDEETEANFARRLNLLIADNERGKQIVINIAGQTFVLPKSTPDGHFKTTLKIPVDDAEPFTRNSKIGFSAVVEDDEPRHFAGEVLLVEPTGLSIISDIDDTVKISEVTARKALLERTFLLDFAAAPGMAALYDSWSGENTSFHFVSSSPWQLYLPLIEFLDDQKFPHADLNLKPVRFRDESLFDLFKKGTETKPQVIEDILAAYPGRRFILVGDSGEQDPEVYADIYRKHPEQILKIYIRNVSGESVDNERFTDVFAGIDRSCWTLFDHPAELPRDVIE